MAQMKLQPVFRCRGCGTSVVISHLSTTQSDPEGNLLREFMQNTAKIALCRGCKTRYNWLAKHDRSEEFNMDYAPEGTLLDIREEIHD